jgi:hypothetical protein
VPASETSADLLAQVGELALRGELEAAWAKVMALADLPEFDGEGLQNLAEALEHRAAAVLPLSRPAAVWLYDRAITLWYGWGAMATSGGDGAARRLSIDAAEERRGRLLGSS